MLITVDGALNVAGNAENKIHFDRPIDLVETTPVKKLSIGSNIASGITLLNGRIYIMYPNISDLSVYDFYSFSQLQNLPLIFPDVKPSMKDIPVNNIMPANLTNAIVSNANITSGAVSYVNHSSSNFSHNNISNSNFSFDNHSSSNFSFDNHSSSNFSNGNSSHGSNTNATISAGTLENATSPYDNRTIAYLAHANISDSKYEWKRDILSCRKTGNLLITMKNSERGIRIWNMDFQSSPSLWLQDPMLESGLKDVIVTGTGCALIIIRIYDNNLFTLTLYYGNGTTDVKIKILLSNLFLDQDNIFPDQAFETKWRTFLLIYGLTSPFVAIEINQKGDVLRTLPRDADKRNLADVSYAMLSTIDVHSTLFVVDDNAKSVAAIDEDLSHSRLLFQSNDTRTCIYSDSMTGQLFLCNSGLKGSTVDIYNIIYHEEEINPNQLQMQGQL